jgi:HD-GYP domain-containing protein (c-di-GMP phosphodiesterase class II)
MEGAGLPSEGMVEFPVENLVDNSLTDFDVFLRLGGNIVLYGGRGYRWERSELNGLLSAGVRGFLIREEDGGKARMYSAVSRVPVIAQTLAPPARIQQIDEIGASLSSCLMEGELTEACISKAGEVARGLVDCIAEDPSCIRAIQTLADHDAYTYHHSVRVAAYTVAIAIGLGITDQELIYLMAIGGLFHDVGKRAIPLDLLNKPGPLTEGEWQLMKEHPQAGWDQLKTTGLSHISLEIVLHHHERVNGTGYPHGLKGSELLPEVQMAALADIFDALTSNRSYQRRRTRFEALAFIKQKLVPNDVWPEAYRALVGVLAG